MLLLLLNMIFLKPVFVSQLRIQLLDELLRNYDPSVASRCCHFGVWVGVLRAVAAMTATASAGAEDEPVVSSRFNINFFI